MLTRFWKIVFYSLGIPPLIYNVSLLAFYFHTGLVLGHLPAPSINDPKDLNLYFFYSPVINWAGEYCFWLFPFWLCFSIVYLCIHLKEVFWSPFVITFLLYALCVGLFFSEVLEWFMD